MHGCAGDQWKHNRHMWPVPANATTVAIDSSPSQFICKVYINIYKYKSKPFVIFRCLFAQFSLHTLFGSSSVSRFSQFFSLKSVVLILIEETWGT